MGLPPNLRMDEMVFYTASSFRKAKALLKASKVDKWSYWEIQFQKLNEQDWPEKVGYYERNGKKIKHPNYDKYEKRFLKHLDKHPI